MDDILQTLLKYLTDPTHAGSIVPIFLCLVIYAMWHDRKRLLEDLKKKDEDLKRKDDRLEKLADDYFKGNITLTEALNSLKVVLFEIKGRLK